MNLSLARHRQKTYAPPVAFTTASWAARIASAGAAFKHSNEDWVESVEFPVLLLQPIAATMAS